MLKWEDVTSQIGCSLLETQTESTLFCPRLKLLIILCLSFSSQKRRSAPSVVRMISLGNFICFDRIFPSAKKKCCILWQHLRIKVHLTPKYFFRSNKSLHLFETHFTFLPRFNPNLDFLQVVKVTKSGHHLLHDRASMGYGSIPGLTSQSSLHACLQRLNTMQISLWHQTMNRPMPFTTSVVWQMIARFRNFYNL